MIFNDLKLTVEEVRAAFDYDAGLGCLRWKVDAGSRARAGSVAGCVGGNGYRQVQYKGVLYTAHRIIWLLVTGKHPVNEIDHRDTVRSNNRFENLREATHAQNQCNTAPWGTHLKGVVKHRHKFEARIRINGSLTYLGLFATEQEAHEAYKAAALPLRGEFARLA